MTELETSKARDGLDWDKLPLIGGIDPGKTGGFVLLDAETGAIEDVLHVPLLKPAKKGSTKREPDWEKMASEWGGQMQFCRHLFIERVWGAAVHGRQQGGAGMFNFGYNAGFIRGMALTWGVPHTLILPAKWRAIVGMSTLADGDQKNINPSFVKAREVWPTKADLFKRVTVDAGVVEAALIGLAGKLLMDGTVEWPSSKK